MVRWSWKHLLLQQIKYNSFFCNDHNILIPLTPRSNLSFSLMSTIYFQKCYSLENLVLDQAIIPKVIFFFILITHLVDIILIWEGEILTWSLMGVKGLIGSSKAIHDNTALRYSMIDQRDLHLFFSQSDAKLKPKAAHILSLMVTHVISLNPLHPNISMHILHTVLYTYRKVLTRRICLTIRSLFSWWPFP